MDETSKIAMDKAAKSTMDETSKTTMDGILTNIILLDDELSDEMLVEYSAEEADQRLSSLPNHELSFNDVLKQAQEQGWTYPE